MTAARDYLAAVQQRADAATDGPWSRHDYGNAAAQEPETIVVHTGKFDWADLSDPEGASAVAWMGSWDSQEDRNAEFIAAARTDVPRLAEALTAVLDGQPEFIPTPPGPQRAVRDTDLRNAGIAEGWRQAHAAITAALTPKENDS